MEDNDDFQLRIKKKRSENSLHYNLLLSARETIDCYLGELSKSKSTLSGSLFEFLRTENKKRKLRARLVTAIGSANVGLATELARDSSLYHTDILGGDFCIIDGRLYLYDIKKSGKENEEDDRYLFSKNVTFVKLQQNLFENLLNHAIPARDKIKEMEQGIQREFIKTLQDPSSILRLIGERIEIAGFDIQVLFATVNSFYRAERDGIIDLLAAARARGINVRVLIKIDDETMKDIPKDLVKKKHDLINVNIIRQPLRSKITNFIIDQSFSLTIEVNDDSRDNFSEATGLATYSNSESTVFTDYSMFENLWIQAELERQNSVRQAYFKMFNGQKLKDETYQRDWSVNEK
ncbi:MAG: hypothetical protein ACJ701_07365 [Nitrososphaera sp.]